jgi:hypothetical protein
MHCRAYKLGKNKHSYNVVHVQIHDASDRSRLLEPLHVVKVGVRHSVASTCLCFLKKSSGRCISHRVAHHLHSLDTVLGWPSG